MDKNSNTILNTGRKIPIMGLGTWQLTHDSAGVIEHAIELGYRMIDTSSDYGTQKGIGEGIKKSGIDRSKLYIVTKVEEMDDAYLRTLSNLDELGLDYVDLTLIHRPPEKGVGKKLWEGLIEARNDGLTHDIGVSNYSETLIDALIEMTGVVPVVNQIEWSPYGHSTDMIRYVLERGIMIQAYSPLTRGKMLNDPRLNRISQRYRKTPAQLLIRWNFQLGSIPIPKANNPKHLKENLEVFDFEISDYDMEVLNDLNKHQSSLGHLPYI